MTHRERVAAFLVKFANLGQLEFEAIDQHGYGSAKRSGVTLGVNVLEERSVLLLLAPIMPLPKKGAEALYRRLLELNLLQTSDAAFAIDPERSVIFARAMRRLDGLDFDEFRDLCESVASVAETWREKLRAEATE